MYTFYPHFEKHHQGNVLDVFHPDAGGISKTRQWAEMEKISRDVRAWKGLGKTTVEWHPLGFGIPCEPYQVATADARHRDLRSASQPQIGLSCHRFPVACIKTAMVRVLSFVLPCHGCWQIGVEGVCMGKGDGATIGTIDLRHGQNMRKPSGDAMEFEGNRKLLSRSPIWHWETQAMWSLQFLDFENFFSRFCVDSCSQRPLQAFADPGSWPQAAQLCGVMEMPTWTACSALEVAPCQPSRWGDPGDPEGHRRHGKIGVGQTMD